MTSKLFIANIIDERGALQELQEAWHHILDFLPEDTPNVTRKPPHLTIRFLGTQCENDKTQAKALRELDHTLQGVAKEFEPIELTLGYIHTFPGVAWVSIGGTEAATQQLEQLAKQVDGAVEKCLDKTGLQAEARKHQFFAHLTLGKFDPSITQLVDDFVRDASYPRQEPFKIEQIQITRSTQQSKAFSTYEREGAAMKLGKPK